MRKVLKVFVLLNLFFGVGYGQHLKLGDQVFELKNITGSIVELEGENVLKIERDLKALPFDVNNLGNTVDEPTYAKLVDCNFENGSIEVKMLSRIQDPSPFEFAQGFIGIAFRIDGEDRSFESIYLRPKVGRSDNQQFRNRTVQYYSYPDFKFDRLRKELNGTYETTAPVALNEWITMRIEVEGSKAYMYINDARYSTFVVEKMKGSNKTGSVALWVDIGTVGYFKDLKIVKH